MTSQDKDGMYWVSNGDGVLYIYKGKHHEGHHLLCCYSLVLCFAVNLLHRLAVLPAYIPTISLVKSTYCCVEHARTHA